VTRYWTELGQNLALFEKYRALSESPGFRSSARRGRRIVENSLRDFRLAGAELEPAQKARFARVQEELATLSAKFSENVLDATNAFSLVIEDERRLAGLPADAVAAAREAALKDGANGRPRWKFTLQMPSWQPVMQYAEDRGTARDAVPRKRHARLRVRPARMGQHAADRRDPAAAQGSRAAARLPESRRSVARAENGPHEPPTCWHSCATSRRRARPFAERDAAEMRDFARAELGITRMQAWDYAFVSESCARAGSISRMTR
jgi:oligopeptidase A